MPCPQICILEDDPDIRETLVEVLQGEGYRTIAFGNGKEALDAMGDCQEACLILCDLMMPVMSGIEFLDARKRFGDTVLDTPVFVVSAVPEQASGRDDVQGFLRKPIDIALLLEVVRGHCGPGMAAA